MSTDTTPVIKLWQATAGARLEPGEIQAADVNWTVNRGEFWVVAGDQHASNSDLLMLAAGMLPPIAGTCQLFGRDTIDLDETQLAERRRVGFVFEDGRLFHDLTLLQNIALPLQYHHNLPAAEVIQSLEPLLNRMELTPLADRRPSELSRNWHKRAGLARALALGPELLLLDNPLHGLGAAHRQWWLHFLDDLVREHTLTVVVSTDDLRPWIGSERHRFALLHEGMFSAAGSWADLLKTKPQVVQSLLAGIAADTAN